ncbi:MAG: GDP-mannose 4,6-dehydratase [candidate division WOR-3 bacterium]
MHLKYNHILIIGIEGFVGRYLAQHLYSLNYKISGIYYQPFQEIGYTIENANKTCEKNKYRLYQCDIRNFEQLFKIINKVSPDAIFHLAAQSSVSVGEAKPIETFEINVLGFLNVLESIRQTKIYPRVIYISSAEVYGSSARQKTKLTEKSLPKPMNFYAFSKYCAEKLCFYYINNLDFDIIILRPFSHTGPGQNEHFVFPRIAKEIVEIEIGKKEPNIKVGNLDVKRDYCDVRDIVKAYQLALEKCSTGKVYNITSSKSYTIRFGVEYLLSLSSKKIKVLVDKSFIRNKDILRLSGSADKFIKQTGWKPEIEFTKTLSDILAYYRRGYAK